MKQSFTCAKFQGDWTRRVVIGEWQFFNGSSAELCWISNSYSKENVFIDLDLLGVKARGPAEYLDYKVCAFSQSYVATRCKREKHLRCSACTNSLAIVLIIPVVISKRLYLLSKKEPDPESHLFKFDYVIAK